jgi:hypothetical protein
MLCLWLIRGHVPYFVGEVLALILAVLLPFVPFDAVWHHAD